MSSIQQLLIERFPQLEFKFDYPLAERTYFKLGGPVEAYIELSEIYQVKELTKFCNEHDIRLTILGDASNVIVADEGVKGVVLHLINDQVEDLHQDIGDKHLLRAGAGIKTALLVRQTVDFGYTGLEYFLGVPGTLGGAIYNNSHYLEDLIGEHAHRVQVIDQAGEDRWLTNTECDFGYDSSRFQKTKEIVFAVEFALATGDPQVSQDKIREATVYRAQTQPLGLPSSGCIFQNTPNTPELKELFPQFADRQFVPGGFLIDQAGLKGTRVGDIEVSDKHAAFMINRGRGTAQQLQELIEVVKARVETKFGVELHEEVFYLG